MYFLCKLYLRNILKAIYLIGKTDCSIRQARGARSAPKKKRKVRLKKRKNADKGGAKNFGTPL